MSCRICLRLVKSRPSSMFVFNSSKEHPGNLRVQSFRSLVTNPSLVGQLSTSKFLASLPPINGINETIEVGKTMSELGFTYYFPTHVAARSIEFLHSSVGLTYIGAIITCGVAVRLGLWYSFIQQQKFMSIFWEHRTVRQEVQYEYDLAKSKYREDEAARLFAEMNYLDMKQHQDMMRAIPHYFVQMVVFVTMSRTLRNCSLALPGFQSGGLSWSPDLTLADTTMMMPCISGLVVFTYLNIQRKLIPITLVQDNPKDKQSTWKTQARVGALASVAGLLSYSGWFSSAFNIYVLTTLSVAGMQNFVTRRPEIEKHVAKYVELPKNYPRRMPRHQEIAMQAMDVSHLKKDEKMTLWGSLKTAFTKSFSYQKSQTKKRQAKAKLDKQQQRYHEIWEKAGTGPVPVTYFGNPLREVERK
ncbi:mitochondrial inner membrane protein OXA1L-like isoform X2 [Symsagittifera roscoffensis]|uniref:mitochondrial inner membrane protein OXA1L-like isoform X2 n=1 Tax=Symsagittifera roscoffensis TaxID=84072 RepID=UPI00307CBA48